MKLSGLPSCDVLVVGSGLAGISAAVAAAEEGASVVMAGLGKGFSGSSFSPDTWGLGLVEPDGPDDREDLMRTILEVGCGMDDPALVRVLTELVSPAVAELRRRGVALRTAACAEKEYIPCFDHKHRGWNGLESNSYRAVMEKTLERLGVQQRHETELVSLCAANFGVAGAIFFYGRELYFQPARATVLATGGFTGLYQNHLTTDDVLGIGNALALRAGATLVNMEFMQMMPGYLSPAYRTVFNEKTFRFATLADCNGRDILETLPNREELMELRSTHGPFTSRLPTREIDLAICRAGTVTAQYSEALRHSPPEFIRVYFNWLAQSKGIDMTQPVQLALFAHASNGGIKIDTNAFTGVEGLFACGEVAGGMHGADRLGGLSTASSLVFGGIAGRQAAHRGVGRLPQTWSICGEEAEGDSRNAQALKEAMRLNAMVERSETGLRTLLDFLRAAHGARRRPVASAEGIARSHRFASRLETACAVADAALLRRESRGSHMRTDYLYCAQQASAHEIRGVSL